MVQRQKLLSSWSTTRSHLTLAARSCTLISDQCCWVVTFSHSIFSVYFQITDMEHIYLFKEPLESYLYKDVAVKYSWHFNL